MAHSIGSVLDAGKISVRCGMAKASSTDVLRKITMTPSKRFDVFRCVEYIISFSQTFWVQKK